MIADQGASARYLDELLKRAQDERLSPAAARAAGAQLADELMKRGRLYEAPLDELTSEAYLGFDARVAAVQAKAGLARS